MNKFSTLADSFQSWILVSDFFSTFLKTANPFIRGNVLLIQISAKSRVPSFQISFANPQIKYSLISDFFHKWFTKQVFSRSRFPSYHRNEVFRQISSTAQKRFDNLTFPSISIKGNNSKQKIILRIIWQTLLNGKWKKWALDSWWQISIIIIILTMNSIFTRFTMTTLFTQLGPLHCHFIFPILDTTSPPVPLHSYV